MSTTGSKLDVFPRVRVYLFGTFTLLRYVPPSAGGEMQEPGYVEMGPEVWESRTAAISLLKLLLCRKQRKASRHLLIGAIFPEREEASALHSLKSAVGVLRNVLREASGEDLLTTSNNGEDLQLADQQRLWLDVDAFEAAVDEASFSEGREADLVVLWEKAYAFLKRGEFEAEAVRCQWVEARLEVLEGDRRLCVHRLAELYLLQGRALEAERVLRAFFATHPTDEDTLYRLMKLSAERGHPHEALRLYERGVADLLDAKQLQPSARITDLAEHIRAAMAPKYAEARTDLLLSAAWFGQKQAQMLAVVMTWRGQALSYDPLQVYIDQEMGGFEAMVQQHPGEADYELSRRQALITIAALPASLFSWRLPGPFSDSAVEEFLPQCAASITACWHLLRGKGFAVAQEVLSQYVPMLMTIALHPSKYQQGAARLATQAKILQAILTMHQLNSAGREMHCHEAVRCARLSGDCRLLAAALMYLGYTYSYCCRPRLPEKALPLFQEALAVLGNEDSLLRSDICMGLADASAQCKEEAQALHYMELAQNHFPTHPEQDPSFIYADCGLDTLYQWEGRMCLDLAEHYPDRGYQQQAWDALVKSTAVPALTARAANETMIYRADAARLLGDLPVYSDCLLEGAQLATALGSQKRYDEALEVFQRTPQRWWREQRVLMLARDVFRQLPGGRIL